MRANHESSSICIFTARVGVKNNDFFTVLTSMKYGWKKLDDKGVNIALETVAPAGRVSRRPATTCVRLEQPATAMTEVYARSDGYARFLK